MRFLSRPEFRRALVDEDEPQRTTTGSLCRRRGCGRPGLSSAPRRTGPPAAGTVAEEGPLRRCTRRSEGACELGSASVVVVLAVVTGPFASLWTKRTRRSARSSSRRFSRAASCSSPRAPRTVSSSSRSRSVLCLCDCVGLGDQLCGLTLRSLPLTRSPPLPSTTPAPHHSTHSSRSDPNGRRQPDHCVPCLGREQPQDCHGTRCGQQRCQRGEAVSCTSNSGCEGRRRGRHARGRGSGGPPRTSSHSTGPGGHQKRCDAPLRPPSSQAPLARLKRPR